MLTKSDLVVRDFDVFRDRAVRVGVTLTTLDERLRRLWEPHAASVARRLEVLKQARQTGLKTTVMFGPLLPGLSDTPESLDALCRQAAALEVDAIWVDAMNPRPRVWPAVAALVRAEFPSSCHTTAGSFSTRPFGNPISPKSAPASSKPPGEPA